MANKKLNSVEVLIEGLDESNITSILSKWYEVTKVRKEIEELEEMLRNKAKAYLKEREWDRYVDEKTKISVSITTARRQDIDKIQLKMMLTDAQYAQVLKTTTYEKLVIITEESRRRLKQYAKAKI